MTNAISLVKYEAAQSVEPLGEEWVQPKENQLFSYIPHPKKRAFLVAFSTTGMLTRAAQIAGVDRSSHYHWLKDPEYRKAFEYAQEIAGDNLESLAFERAQDKRDPGSTTLLIFLLKAVKPEKYRERVSTEISGSLQRELKVQDPGRDVLSDERLKNLLELAQRIEQIKKHERLS